MNKKLAKVMLEVGSLTADARNTHDNYDYVSSDKILEVIGKALGEESVAVIPAITNVTTTLHSRQGDKIMWQADVFMEMTILADGSEYKVPWFGCGIDYRVPDKAVYKAVTSGHSYFLRKLVSVGVGNENGEHDPAEDFKSGGSPAKITNPGDVKVAFPKAKELFGGKEPTVADLFAKDPDYCDWIYQNGKGAAADAMRQFIDFNASVQREAKDSGKSAGVDMLDAIENAETILNETKGKLTPSHYWPMVRKMGLDEQVAADIASACESDWRKGLQMAVDAVRGAK